MATDHNFRIKNGLEVGGQLIVTSSGALVVSSVHSSLSFLDNVKAKFGNGSDLQIFHDGNNSWISDAGTGSLIINGDNVYLRSYGGESKADFITNGAVTLYHDNSAKIATTSAGIDVTGRIDLDDSNTQLSSGSGNSLRIQTDSGYTEVGPQNTTWSHFETDRGRFYFNKGLTVNTGLIGSYDEDLQIQRAGTTKLTVTTTGVDIVGDLSITGDLNTVNTTTLDVSDKVITAGVGGTAATNSGGGFKISGANVEFIWDNTNTQMTLNKDLKFTASEKLRFGNTYFNKSGDSNNVHFYAPAGFIPHSTTASSNATLGSSSYRWDGVYSTTGNFSGAITGGGAIGNIGSQLGQQLELGNTTTATLRFDSDNWRLYSGGTGSSGEVFTISQTGNATFTGTISSGAITSSGVIESSGADTATSGQLLNLHGSSLNQTNSGTIRFTEASYDTSPFFQGGFIKYDGSANQLKIGTHHTSDSNLSNDIDAITIARSTGNATFGGTISSGAITSTSSITANNGANVIQLGTDGNIEITRTSGGAYIDFKDSTSEDYDQRIQATTTGHSFSGTISSGAITASSDITVSESGSAKILSNSVGDYFPSINISRTSGSTKTNYEYEFQIGSSGFLNFKDKTNGYYPLVFKNNGDVTLANDTASANPVLTLDQSASSATFAGTISSGAITSTGNISTTGSVITVDPASGDAILSLQGAAGGQTLRIDQNSIRTSTNSAITFLTNSTNVLTLDTSQNATFTGTINSGAITSTVINTGDATLLTLHHDTGADIAQQKSFIDFSFEDDNTNETPQVRIGAEVGQNANADSQIKEGSGAFVVYTNNANTTSGAAGASLVERMRVDYQGNVGIGETAPGQKLQVNGNIRADGHYYVGGAVVITSAKIAKMANGTNAAPAYTFDGDTDTGMYIGSSNSLQFSTGGVMRLNLDSSGHSNFTGQTRTDDWFQVNSSSSLLKVNISAWSTHAQQDVLRNSYNSTIGDYLTVKASGNGVDNHGAIVISDNIFAYGRTEKAAETAASLTAPFTTNSFQVTSSGNATFAGTVTATGGNSTNWNTAYGWGDHGSAGYLTSSSTQSKYLRSDADDTFGNHTLTIQGTVRSTNNANTSGPNFNVSTTNKSNTEYAYRVDRSGSVVGGIRIDGILIAPGGNSGNWNTAYGWGNYASAPNAPSISSTTVVNETIEIVFAASTSTGNTAATSYEVWSDGGTGSDYSLIAKIPYNDIASSMSVVDSSFDDSGTIAYRVYAIRHGAYSTAATTTRAFSMPTLDVSSMSVIPDTNNYYIQYELPSTRFIDHIEIYKDVETTSAALARVGAALVYSGNNTSYKYNISSSDMDKYHQFWVEVVTV